MSARGGAKSGLTVLFKENPVRFYKLMESFIGMTDGNSRFLTSFEDQEEQNKFFKSIKAFADATNQKGQEPFQEYKTQYEALSAIVRSIEPKKDVKSSSIPARTLSPASGLAAPIPPALAKAAAPAAPEITTSYFVTESIVQKLKEKFAASEADSQAALKFLADNKEKVRQLNNALKKAWDDKGVDPSSIGFQSCVKIAFTQNAEVIKLLKDPENIKAIFYLSALRSEMLRSAGLQDLTNSIFDTYNHYTKLTISTNLTGADAPAGKAKVTNSFFSLLFFLSGHLLFPDSPRDSLFLFRIGT